MIPLDGSEGCHNLLPHYYMPPAGINIAHHNHVHSSKCNRQRTMYNVLQRGLSQSPSGSIPKQYRVTGLAEKGSKSTFPSATFRIHPHQLVIPRFSCLGTDVLGSQTAAGFQQLDLILSHASCRQNSLQVSHCEDSPATRTNRTPRGGRHFWFRTRHVSAHASQISDLHPHILRLWFCPSTMASFFTSATVPAFAQSWVEAVLPEWLFPDCASLKTQKPGQDEEIMGEYFDTEVEAYQRLKPLQGAIIPMFYILLRYNGTRALLLEYLRGIPLSAPEGATMILEELSSLLQPCYRALHAFDLYQDEANLSNFQPVEGKIKVLDLESAVFHYSADQRATFLVSSVRHLARHYLSNQAYYRHQGSLEVS